MPFITPFNQSGLFPHEQLKATEWNKPHRSFLPILSLIPNMLMTTGTLSLCCA